MRSNWAPENDPARNPSTAILAGHMQQFFGYRIIRPEGTPNWLMIYTPAGRGRTVVNKKRFSCEAGTLAIWAPGTPHDYGIANEAQVWDQLWAHYVPGVRYERVLQHLTSRQPFHLLKELDTQLVQDCMHKVAEQPHTGIGELRAINLMESLLLDLTEETWHTQDDGPVEIARSYIATHLNGALGIEEIADAVGLSTSRLTSLFGLSLGISPRAYVERERMNYAMQLLRLTSQSVQSISQQVGFENPFYFTLRFKKHSGMSPTEYRKKA
jgi:AraC family transcriptional regulator, arabinose operon regulatory protein